MTASKAKPHGSRALAGAPAGSATAKCAGWGQPPRSAHSHHDTDAGIAGARNPAATTATLLAPCGRNYSPGQQQDATPWIPTSVTP